MNDRFTKNAKLSIEYAKEAAGETKRGSIGTEHILLGLIRNKNCLASKILYNYSVTNDLMTPIIEKFTEPLGEVIEREPEGFTPGAQELLNKSIKEAERYGVMEVGTGFILGAMLKDSDSSAFRLLATVENNISKMYFDILAAMGMPIDKIKEEMVIFRNPEKSVKNDALSRFGKDLTEAAAKGMLDPVFGREEEIQRTIQILSRRTKNNPCLVGEPGVGKTAIIEAIATRLAAGDVPETLANKRIYTLDLASMVAGTKYRGEFEDRIKKVIGEVAANKNIILFIDEIHTMIGAGGAEGSLDAANILKPALSRGEVQVIGATTIKEYRKHFEKDAALERRFQPVNVEETDFDETVTILEGIKDKYEAHHQVAIETGAVEAAVRLSTRYINERFLPDKAIDLLDEACARVNLKTYKVPDQLKDIKEDIEKLKEKKEICVAKEQFERVGEIMKLQKELEKEKALLEEKWNKSKKAGKHHVTEADVAEVISGWTKIPLKKISEGESKRLKNLEKQLHERVVGQDEAVTAVAKAVRRGRVGLKDPKRPIGSFLFLGPTGVGKTELSKSLAEAVFGSESSVIRVDMSEYMEKQSVSKMIGSPPGYVGFEEGGQLSDKVRSNPYSVILFDEIEKAHPDVFNVLLQILDDGHVTDSQGRKVSFKNTIIIMTSNAGAGRIIDPKKLGFGATEDEKADYEKMKQGVMEELKRIFKPEFLNRIDDTIVFHPLNKDDNLKIGNIMLNEIVKRAKAQLDMDINVTAAAKKYIVEKGYDKKYGARPLRRAIQTMVEDKLAEEILDGNIKKGDRVTVSVANKELKFTVEK